MRKVEENYWVALDQLQTGHMADLGRVLGHVRTLAARGVLHELLKQLDVEPEELAHHVVLEDLILVLALVHHQWLASEADPALQFSVNGLAVLRLAVF